MAKALVNIVMGSASDWPVMEAAAELLTQLGIAYEVTVSSAHRAPRRTAELSRTAADRGVQVMIAGAGGAAHLAGVIAAETILPVIRVPIDSSPLGGMDALLATVQMHSRHPGRDRGGGEGWGGECRHFGGTNCGVGFARGGGPIAAV